MTTYYKTTDNERAVMIALECSNYGNGECWSFDINDQSSRPSSVTGRALSAVCGSLIKKGLAHGSGTGRDQYIALTEDGRAIARQLIRDMEAEAGADQ